MGCKVWQVAIGGASRTKSLCLALCTIPLWALAALACIFGASQYMFHAPRKICLGSLEDDATHFEQRLRSEDIRAALGPSAKQNQWTHTRCCTASTRSGDPGQRIIFPRQPHFGGCVRRARFSRQRTPVVCMLHCNISTIIVVHSIQTLPEIIPFVLPCRQPRLLSFVRPNASARDLELGRVRVSALWAAQTKLCQFPSALFVHPKVLILDNLSLCAKVHCPQIMRIKLHRWTGNN
jgi:hypothetical protein